jgi:uncharacterized Zn finger protein (UPF0148 family)
MPNTGASPLGVHPIKTGATSCPACRRQKIIRPAMNEKLPVRTQMETVAEFSAQVN